MTLEDHVGDVLRKARMMAGIPAEESAAAATLTPAQLDVLEQSGTAPAAVDWQGLGARLSLHPAKLRRLAEGWLPRPVDASGWREFRMVTTSGENMSVNCYLVWDEVTLEAALFDTGFDAAPIFALLDEHQLKLEHIFITHSHGDHVAALEAVRNRHPRARLHTSSPSAPPQHRNRANDFIHLGSLRITNRDTPGHAEDGVTYVVGNFPDDAPNLAIVGDALFAGSMGGAPGRGALARGKVRDQILSLPAATLICPGHGPLTTVGEQLEANPFFP